MKKKKLHTEQVMSPLTVSRINEVVTLTNSVMQQLKDHLYGFEIPDFGSSLYACNTQYCVFHSSDTIIASLVTDRITNKFEAPSRNTESLLKRRCYSDWIGYEREHLDQVALSSLSKREREPIWGASRLIYQWMNGYANGRYFYERSFNHFIEKAPIEFGPGESFISSRGHVHLYGKLDPRTSTVTFEAVNFAALIVSSNKGLRKVFLETFKKQPRSLYKVEQQIAFKKALVQRSKIPLKVRVFAEMVKNYWETNGLIQYGSRGSSVYKNSSKRRFINIECLMNVIIQKMIAWALRACLKTNAKIDLDLGQDYHKSLIKSDKWTTVDFSNASDSILTQLVKTLFWSSPDVLRYMETVRSSYVLIPTPVETGSGLINMYHEPLKFSSMGNGYTFELLTLVTASIGRFFDKSASSYGDDVIISTEYAEDYIQTMINIGFQVNKKKTFHNLPFRESCGGFYLDYYGYIASFDFKWNYNIADVITTVNKLGRILRYNPMWKHKVKDAIQSAYNDIDALVPRALRGPISDLPDIPVWVESKNWLRGHRKDDYSKNKFITYRKLIESISHSYGYSPIEWAVVQVPELKKNIAINPKRDVKSWRLAYSYIYSARVSPMLIRQQKPDYKYAFKPTLVHVSGLALRAATARRVCSSLTTSYLSEFLSKLKDYTENRANVEDSNVKGAA